MNILAIDTSCDETAASVTADFEVTSNKVWSQASLHAKYGGVFPSLAQRQHEQRIDYVIDRALGSKHKKLTGIDAIAVTIGPGLSIALGVGINKAKELAKIHNLSLIPVNHAEAHLLSPFARPQTKKVGAPISFPALGLVLSGGTTKLMLVEGIGKYKVLAETGDDALGEALDKGARLLGFGYPGASFLEKMAKLGNPNRFKLPLPLKDDHIKNRFSYSGLKTAFVRLFSTIPDPNKQDIADLAAIFQKTAFEHVFRVLEYQIKNLEVPVKDLLFGGGVANNVEIRKGLRKLCKKHNIVLRIPYTKKLMGDNAAMIGVCAYLKNKDKSLSQYYNYVLVDRDPRLSI